MSIEVTEVMPGSEAERVGIRVGDHIEAYDSLDIGSNAGLFVSNVSSTEGRENVLITVTRLGTIKVKGGKLGLKVSGLEQTPSDSSGVSAGVPVHNEFMTLASYGRFMAGFGWFIVMLGGFAALIGLGVRGIGIIGLFGGVFVAIMGVGFVVNGQLVSCFVSIEKNTRKTTIALEALNNQQK